MTKKVQPLSREVRKEAQEIIDIYRFYQLDGHTYLSNHSDAINDLFDSVILALHSATFLQEHLPYQEFIHPSNEVLKGDPGWVGHFMEQDHKKFFLSDVHDYLRLYFGKSS